MIDYDHTGEGPSVVLVHGHPFDRTLWRPQQRMLASSGYSVVAPDLRGYGSSPAQGDVVTMAELAADVADLLDHLEIVEPVVVGLSMGGLVAMEMALSGMALRGLGLVATTAQPVIAEEQHRRRAAADAAEREGMAPLVRQMIDGGLFPTRCPPAVVDAVTTMMAGNNAHGAAAALRGRAVRPDYRPGLATLRLPVWVCVGEADPWSTTSVTEELVGCLADPTVTLLPDVGHLPNLEAPAEFDRALLHFLARL